MDKKLQKVIKIVSIVLIIIGSAVALGFQFLKGERSPVTWFDIMMFWIVAMVFPLLALITSYLVNHPEKIVIRKIGKYTLYFYPLILGLIFLLMFLSDGSLIFSIILGLVIAISSILLILQLFVFSDAGKVTATIVLMSLLIIGIVFKRLHLPLAGAILTFSLLILSLGFYVYGIWCLYLAERNRFIKYVSFLSCCVVSISLLGLMCKLQRWPLGDAFIISGRWGLVLGTVAVLLILPSSGYFEWKELHKKILKKLILPWGLLFLLFVLKFLLPEVDAIVWSKEDNRVYPGFEMYDYEIRSEDNIQPR